MENGETAGPEQDALRPDGTVPWPLCADVQPLSRALPFAWSRTVISPLMVFEKAARRQFRRGIIDDCGALSKVAPAARPRRNRRTPQNQAARTADFSAAGLPVFAPRGEHAQERRGGPERPVSRVRKVLPGSIPVRSRDVPVARLRSPSGRPIGPNWSRPKRMRPNSCRSRWNGTGNGAWWRGACRNRIDR